MATSEIELATTRFNLCYPLKNIVKITLNNPHLSAGQLVLSICFFDYPISSNGNITLFNYRANYDNALLDLRTLNIARSVRTAVLLSKKDLEFFSLQLSGQCFNNFRRHSRNNSLRRNIFCYDSTCSNNRTTSYMNTR